MERYYKNIKINHGSIIPKYRQLADAILYGIENDMIEKERVLPSLHQLCVILDVSKNTIEKAYNTLKKAGIVQSVHGKGYIIAGANSGCG